MQEIVFIVEQEEDGGFVAEAKVNDNEQIITEGDNIEELKSMIREALECHFENSEDMPKTVRLHFIKDEVFVI
ncbi:2-oxoisovalerate dehydrogenase [Dyadobacter frigoris]|uniref:2-oxoisovalerate dehydrogenase n=2 Tax=Dyadobacter frigoris TaxID=2576211 RepID=A0A4U6D822_9BACT|nr:2-oxoisovalerate dehydrogenase [Dyadobacter frigoris]